jgi:putative SOS response-associated peptidase YedK
VKPEGGGLLAFAGLWERWDKGEGPVESGAIITTEASDAMRGLHDRMPVILSPDAYAAWLDPSANPTDLLALLRPFAGGLGLTAVGTRVNNPRNEGPECLEPAEG